MNYVNIVREANAVNIRYVYPVSQHIHGN